MEGWDDYQIQTLSYGGNSRLEEFLSPYLVSLDKDKYSCNVFNLKATEFYSRRLEAFSSSGYFSEPPPSLEEGKRLIDSGNVLDLNHPNPEDDGQSDLLNLNERPMKITDEDEDFFNKLDSGIKELFETTGDIFQEHASKIWQSTTGVREVTKGAWDTTNEAGKTAIDKTGEFTKNTWEKTKNVSQDSWEKTKDVSKSVWDKTKEFVSKIKSDEEEPSFKNFFGLFKNDAEEKKENIVEHEQQYFDFDNKEEVKDNIGKSPQLKGLIEDIKTVDEEPEQSMGMTGTPKDNNLLDI